MTASRRAAAAVLALGLAAAGAHALEISLEENKAERGNIGYIDLQKVFKLYPETHKAKQSYSELVRQAEEQINLKKADILALRAELAKAKLERDLFAKTPIPAMPAPDMIEQAVIISTDVLTPAATEAVAAPDVEAPLVSTAPPVIPEIVEVSSPPATAPIEVIEPIKPAQPEPTPEAAPPAKAEPTPEPKPAPKPVREIPAELRGLPGMSTPLGGENPEPPDEELIINIPGVTEQPVVVSPPSGETAERAAAIAEKAESARKRPDSSTPPPAGPIPAVKPGTALEWLAYEESKRKREERRLELEARVAELELKLAAAEEAFAKYEQEIEGNLMDIESRRSEILLGKIYKAVREVARQSGVSVVVDKSQILFGQGSVDLTDAVIKRLEGSSQ